MRLLTLWLLSIQFCLAATYEVGPGKPLASIGAVPWATLGAGDTVLIHWRATPYKEKWVIGRQGTAIAPITVRGVAGTGGELPVIDGNGAVTAPGLNFWSESRGVIKIGGSNVPADTTPRYIVIENLEIRSARPPYQFTDDGGNTQSYPNNAAPIYVEKGENITIRNCRLHDSGNGLFVASSDELTSKDILIDGNYIYDNGNTGSLFEHNTYTAAVRITYQNNRFGPLRSGALGNNLKDRSAGLVVRYNWIEGGNRQLDLVDGEDSSLIRLDPLYRQTFVYGNVLMEPAGAGNRQIVHYGGDSGSIANYRKGTLHFYNNTIVSTRTDRTTLFRLSTNEERCDARNNIFYVSAAGSTLSLVDADGILDFQHNWLKPGWVTTFGTLTGTINNAGGNVQGAAPGFIDEAAQDFRLADSSPAVNQGTALHTNAQALDRQYRKHQASDIRPVNGALDIGAYEVASGTVPPICGYTLATNSAAAPANGTTGGINLTVTGTACSWTAAPGTSWVQVSPLSGTTSQIVNYTVFPNFAPRTRSAVVTIAGHMFTITQAADAGTATERFVRLIYFTVFGRIPSTAEVAFQVAALNSGTARGQLVEQFMASQEFNNAGRFIAGLYLGLLARDAEYGGWLFQRNALATGQVQYGQLTANFLSSPEWVLKFGQPDNAAFVRLLYRHILLREATDAEVAFQTAALTSGTTRVQLATGFLSGVEFRNGTGPRLTAFLIHALLLQRDATPSELTTAAQRLAAGVAARTLIDETLATTEFNNLVN